MKEIIKHTQSLIKELANNETIKNYIKQKDIVNSSKQCQKDIETFNSGVYIDNKSFIEAKKALLSNKDISKIKTLENDLNLIIGTINYKIIKKESKSCGGIK